MTRLALGLLLFLLSCTQKPIPGKIETIAGEWYYSFTEPVPQKGITPHHWNRIEFPSVIPDRKGAEHLVLCRNLPPLHLRDPHIYIAISFDRVEAFVDGERIYEHTRFRHGYHLLHFFPLPHDFAKDLFCFRFQSSNPEFIGWDSEGLIGEGTFLTEYIYTSSWQDVSVFSIFVAMGLGSFVYLILSKNKKGSFGLVFLFTSWCLVFILEAGFVLQPRSGIDSAYWVFLHTSTPYIFFPMAFEFLNLQAERNLRHILFYTRILHVLLYSLFLVLFFTTYFDMHFLTLETYYEYFLVLESLLFFGIYFKEQFQYKIATRFIFFGFSVLVISYMADMYLDAFDHYTGVYWKKFGLIFFFLSLASVHFYKTELEKDNYQKKLLDLTKELDSKVKLRTREIESLLDIASHDIKNPIHSILSLSDLLLDKKTDLPPSKVREFAGFIRTSADNIRSLIDKLIELKRFDSGANLFKLSEVNLLECIHKSIHDFQPSFDAKSLKLITVIPETPLAIVMGEKKIIEQILFNLISNSIKFSPIGEWVRISLNESIDKWTFEVEDHGEGISESELSRIFDRFAKISTRPTAGEPTTGLGLSIVKNLVESMRGTIYCQSKLGVGTRFSVEFSKPVTGSGGNKG